MWCHGLTCRTRFEEVRILSNKVDLKTQLKTSKMAQWKKRERKGRARMEDSSLPATRESFRVESPTPREAVYKEDIVDR